MKREGSARHIGHEAEQTALRYLQRHGLTPVTQNFQTRLGEIDLIMRDGAQLVFVEVRWRQNPRFGDAAESITRGKKRRICAAASQFLATYDPHERLICRFDVVTFNPANRQSPIDWIQDAFDAS